MDWFEWMRLFALAAMALGAWRSWRRRPRKIMVDDVAYFRREDGRVTTRWGKPVTDRELLERIELEERSRVDGQVTRRSP